MAHGFEFEVVGKVQGVFFRKYTKMQADRLGLRGWVMNTPRGSVTGAVIGSKPGCDSMKVWLQREGSPKSRITGTTFTNEGEFADDLFPVFEIRT